MYMGYALFKKEEIIRVLLARSVSAVAIGARKIVVYVFSFCYRITVGRARFASDSESQKLIQDNFDGLSGLFV